MAKRVTYVYFTTVKKGKKKSRDVLLSCSYIFFRAQYTATIFCLLDEYGIQGKSNGNQKKTDQVTLPGKGF